MKAVADLVTYLVVFAFHQLWCSVSGGCGKQLMIDGTTCSDAACDHELDEIPAVLTHAISPWMMGVAASCCPSPRVRMRYHRTMVNSEKTKMIDDTALISGVIPRRKRDQISKGKVFSR